MFIKKDNEWVDKHNTTLNQYLSQYGLDTGSINKQLTASNSFVIKTHFDIVLKFEINGDNLKVTPYQSNKDSDLKFVYFENKLVPLSDNAGIFIDSNTRFLDLEKIKSEGYDYYLDFKENITIIGLMNVLDTSEFSNYKNLEEDLDGDISKYYYLTVLKSYDEITTQKLKEKLKENSVFMKDVLVYQTGVDEFTLLSTYILNSIITNQMIISYNYFPITGMNKEEILEKRKLSFSEMFNDSNEEEENIIRGYFRALYHKTDETAEHSDRLQKIVTLIGEELMLNAEEIQLLWKMAKVHDIGKLAVEGKIINKAGKLNFEEFEIIKKHTILGYEMLKGLQSYQEALLSPLQHHEFWNGKGYPNQLKGEEINFLVRIISVADAIDTMASKRVYKDVYSFSYIKEELDRCQGNQFCPIAAKAALNVIDEIEKLYVTGKEETTTCEKVV